MAPENRLYPIFKKTTEERIVEFVSESVQRVKSAVSQAVTDLGQRMDPAAHTGNATEEDSSNPQG